MSSKKILVYDRKTGALFEEAVPGGGFLVFLYQTKLGGILARLLGGSTLFSRAVGLLYRSPLSVWAIKGAIRSWGIDMREYQVPPKGFRSFNEFFIRRLRPEARKINTAPESVISPCDARLLAVPEVREEGKLQVKGSTVDLKAFLSDEALSSHYHGGTALIYRLAPADYHWFHFPEKGVPSPAVRLSGTLHSVSPLALSAGRKVLQTNRRQRTIVETQKGKICMVEIGAMCVGSVVQTYTPGKKVSRGEEKGYFQFGGSTVAVLYGRGTISVDEDILERSDEGIETLVKVGEKVGTYVV